MKSFRPTWNVTCTFEGKVLNSFPGGKFSPTTGISRVFSEYMSVHTVTSAVSGMNFTPLSFCSLTWIFIVSVRSFATKGAV